MRNSNMNKLCETCRFHVLDDDAGVCCTHKDGFCVCFDGGKKYHTFKDSKPGCTCKARGPRLEGHVICDYCHAYSKKMGFVFPGEPGWRLNPGWLDRQSWGIYKPNFIKIRQHAKWLRFSRMYGMSPKTYAVLERLRNANDD